MTPPIRLRYGNTNTYFVGGLLIDTDLPGTLSAFRRETKRQGIAQSAVRYVLATHYHPDHMGLIGELMGSGVRLLLPDHQVPYVHAYDAVCARDPGTGFVPVDESLAIRFPASASREILASIGISGEILPTGSHSPDGAALILDDGNAFVGDLEPRAFLEGYDDNPALREDWKAIVRLGAGMIHYGHANSARLTD